MKLAIHSVFICKENICFLEEWILYHISLGFNKFYLYDNSKVTKSGGCHPNHKCFKVGKVNKYNVNYDKIVNMTDEQMYTYLKKLCNKYKCIEIINWSPIDDKGNILHNQVEAHNHCLKILKRDKIDWCANIDMDEYIVINKFDNISKVLSLLSPKIINIKLGQIRFDSRFNNLDKLVTDITNSEIKHLDRNHSNKNIYKVNDIYRVEVHSIIVKQEISNLNKRELIPSTKEIWFNHYKSRQNNYKYVNNINKNIKIRLNNNTFIPLK